MPLDGEAPVARGDPDLTRESFEKLREKMEEQLRNDPNSVNPMLVALAEQHQILHQKMTAQSESYTILMQLHIRREEIAILEKLEFAETIKAYQLKLIEGKKLRNRQERLNDIEKAYTEKRGEAKMASAILRADIDTFNQIKTTMELTNGQPETMPLSLTSLNLDGPILGPSHPSAPKPAPPQPSPSQPLAPGQRNPETENIVEPMTDILVECLEEAKRNQKDKDDEIAKLKERIAEFEAKEVEWKKEEERRGEEDAERKRKEQREQEMAKKKEEDPTLSSLYAENDRLNLQLVKCYSGLASYQKTNQRLVDMVFLAEKTASVDRIQAADLRHTLKIKLNELDANYQSVDEIRTEFQSEMLNIEKRMLTTNENLKELKENLEVMCMDTFGETVKVVGGANWKAKSLQEAFAHKPVLSDPEQELLAKKQELRELKEQLRLLEREYQRELNPRLRASDMIIKHLLEELDIAIKNMKDQLTHHAVVVERCRKAEENQINLRRSTIKHMKDLSSQVTSVTGLTPAQLEFTSPAMSERITMVAVENQMFAQKEKKLIANMEKMIEGMMEKKEELRRRFEEGIAEEVGEEPVSEEKLTLVELREKYRDYDATLKEMEKSIDPTIPRLNRQLTHMFGEQQASYALLVERYISGEDTANDERRANADTIRQLRMQLLDAKRGNNRQKKIQEIDQEYRERLEVIQKKHREVKKVVDEMKTELENLSMETFGEALEERKKETGVKTCAAPEVETSDFSGAEGLIKRLFHKVSFSAGVINTALERLINQVKINMRHDERDIRMRALGYVLEVTEEHNLMNISDLTKFLASMQKTKVSMGDYFESALKEADERGIDYSLVPMDYDASEQKYKVPNINKTPAETLAQTIANNRKTRDFFNMAKASSTTESAHRLEQRLFVANLNIQEREKQMAAMKQRMEITENVLKARHQLEIDELRREIKSQNDGEGAPTELEKKMAQAFKKKPAAAPKTDTTSSAPAPPSTTVSIPTEEELKQAKQHEGLLSERFPRLSKETIEEIRESIVRAIYEAAGCDVSKSAELMTRLLSAFSLDVILKEEKDAEQLKTLEARVGELQQQNETISKKLEESAQAFLAKERQVSVLETGYLRRGLGMSRRQLAGARIDDEPSGVMKGLRNSTNQAM